MENLIDLSQEIHKDALVFAAHPRPMILPYAAHQETAREYGIGFSFQSRLLQMSDHMGTHVDAFSHVDPDPGSPDISQMHPNLFWGPALCLDVSGVPPKTYITVNHLEDSSRQARLAIEKGDILLLYSGHWRRTQGRPEFLTDYAGPDGEAARWLAARGIKALGVEAPSADNPEDLSFPTHRILVQNRIVVIENLVNLEEVVNRRFRFFGLPLRNRGGTGSPVRAFALLENGTPPQEPPGLEDLMRLSPDVEYQVRALLADLMEKPAAEEFALIGRACSAVKKGLPRWEALLAVSVHFLILGEEEAALLAREILLPLNTFPLSDGREFLPASKERIQSDRLNVHALLAVGCATMATGQDEEGCSFLEDIAAGNVIKLHEDTTEALKALQDVDFAHLLATAMAAKGCHAMGRFGPALAYVSLLAHRAPARFAPVFDVAKNVLRDAVAEGHARNRDWWALQRGLTVWSAWPNARASRCPVRYPLRPNARSNRPAIGHGSSVMLSG